MAEWQASQVLQHVAMFLNGALVVHAQVTDENKIKTSAAGSATDRRGRRRKIPPYLEIRATLMNRAG
jgi:hypothetical protein